MIRSLLIAALFLPSVAFATNYTDATTGKQSPGVVIESAPGSAISGSNPLQVAGTFSATLAGFTPTTPISEVTIAATTTTAQSALPTGTSVLICNTGANTAWVNFGTSSAVTATTSNIFVPASSCVGASVPAANTNIAAITASSTTTIQVVGGSGLATSFGGGGGGSSSNASVSATGAAVPGSGTYLAASVGGTLTGLTATANGLKVDGSGATQPVSGTVAATQSGNWTSRVVGNAGGVLDAAGQNAASPANELLTGCQFNTAPTTITTTNMSPVQCDNAGNTLVNLKTAIPAGANVIGAVTQSGNWTARIVGNGGGVLDAAGQNAASPANELLIAAQFNTSPTTITSGNVSPLQVDASGNLLVNIKAGGAAGGTSSSFAAAFPATGTAIGVKNGANMVNLTADASSNLNVNINAAIAAGANTIGKFDLLGNAGAIMDFAGQNAASPANAILTGCQFNTSPTTITSGNVSPVQCNNAGAVTVAAVCCTAGSTSSGQFLSPVAGFVTTANPSYTTAQTNAASLDVAGGLRVVGNGPVSAGTAQSGSLLGANVYNSTAPAPTTGQQVASQADPKGNHFVNIQAATGVASPINKSGSITTGGTAQNADTAATTLRTYLLVENGCTSTSQGIGTAESLFVDFGTAATNNSTSIELGNCGSIIMETGYVAQGTISVNAATTGHKFIVKVVEY